MYVVASPVQVGNVSTWLETQLGKKPTILGFDFVIGLPREYARQQSFLDFLDTASPSTLTKVNRLDHVNPARPFFFGTGTKAGLVQKILGRRQDPTTLLRACETGRAYRGAGELLFWCQFGKQVGTATLHGWKNVVIPARKRGVAMWPFDGADLNQLLKGRQQVILETYPGDAYSVLGVAGNRRGCAHGATPPALKFSAFWSRRLCKSALTTNSARCSTMPSATTRSPKIGSTRQLARFCWPSWRSATVTQAFRTTPMFARRRAG